LYNKNLRSIKANDTVKLVTYKNGPSQTQVAAGLYSYTPFGQITYVFWSLDMSQDATVTGLENLSYTYDPGGRLTQEGRLARVPRLSPETEFSYQSGIPFAYDSNDDLTTDNTNTYLYDNNGNRTQQNGQILTVVANQLRQDALWVYGYDGEGNLTDKRSNDPTTIDEHWIYAYDYANRVVSATEYTCEDTSLQNPLEQITYRYDALGNRVERTITVYGSSPTTATTRFAYDGNKLWADLDGNNALLVRYVRDESGSSLFARVDTNNGNLWYLTDYRGSVIDLIDYRGTILNRLRYDAFLVKAARLDVPDRFRIMGQEFDGDTALQFDGKMWSDPYSGRTESPEDLSLGYSPNPYTEAAKSPTNTRGSGADIGLFDSALDGFSSLLFSDDARTEKLDERVNQVRAKLGLPPLAPTPSTLRTAVYAAGEGLRDSASIFANTFTFGLIDPLNQYVARVVKENGGAYEFAQYLSVGARELLLTAVPIARGVTHALSGGYLRTFALTRGAGATINAGKEVWQTAVTQGDNAGFLDYVGAGFRGAGAGALDPISAVTSTAGSVGGYYGAKALGANEQDQLRALQIGNLFGTFGGAGVRGFAETGRSGAFRALGADLAGATWGLAESLINGTDPLEAVTRSVAIANSLRSGWELLKRACFAAGTPLLTPTGEKPIERFLVGDLILSREENDPRGLVEAKQVEEVFVRTGRIMNLHVGGHVIQTTAEHPFWVHGKGWVAAGQLAIGDLLSSHDGQWVALEDLLHTGEVETVYNLRIADYHTYFVGSRQWAFSVWAHNSYSDRVSADEATRIAGQVANAKNNRQQLPDEYLSLTVSQRRRIDALASPMLNADVIHGNSNASQSPQIGYRLVKPGNNNELWHYGITQDFQVLSSGQIKQTRYTQAWLDENGFNFEGITGVIPNRAQARSWEGSIINSYIQLNGHPPPGNLAGTR
jgi:hypothetical protein